MTSFRYGMYCPFEGTGCRTRPTNHEIANSGKEPTLHKWYTDAEKICWKACQGTSGQNLYFGEIRAVCRSCGAQTPNLSIAAKLTESERDKLNQEYSAASFSSGELFEKSMLLTKMPIAGVIVNGLLDNGVYSSEEYITDYCLKATEQEKKHKWHTDDAKLSWYGEPCGNWPLVKGYCLLCGAKSDSLTISYPISHKDKARIQELQNEYSKDKFNNGEYNVHCWSYTLNGKICNHQYYQF